MPTESSLSRLRSLLAAFPAQRILVIGDLMLDEFIWGRVSRISPEAPVPVVNVVRETAYPGGAANVARNIREFTASTSVMGVLGADAQGCRLIDLLRSAGIDTTGVQQDTAAVTTVKTRIIARNQQVVRVDRERRAELTASQTESAMADFSRSIANVDAIVVANYGKGFLNQAMADYICRSARKENKILTVDPHPHTSLSWEGATAVKPNREEAFQVAGLPASEPVVPVTSDGPLLEAGGRLLRLWHCGSLLVTLGEHGMLLFQDGAAPYHIPTHARDVFDVSGAGDTAIAVLTLALAAGATPVEAAELANRASGIVVAKLGTNTVGAAELEASLSR